MASPPEVTYPDSYLATALRCVGVREPDVEDCLQEMKIYFWRWGCSGPQSVRSAAVDAARKYGARTRWHRRIEYVAIEAADGMTADPDHSRPVVREFLATLTAHQRSIVIKRLRGDQLSESERQGLYHRVRAKWVKFAG